MDNLFTYVVVLNWNSDEDTINCIKSLLEVKGNENLKIIVCDNNSNEDSFKKVRNYISNLSNVSSLLINENAIFQYKNTSEKIVLIRNNENYGYAGGNNRGIKFAINQKNMINVWILNNDTIVQKGALISLIEKINSNRNYGVCGCCLVEYESKQRIQGIGGLINKWSFTAKEIGSNIDLEDNIDEVYYENQIDYVIGASFIITKECLLQVGLLCEEYFLYYEEYDYCMRAKQKNFLVGIASKSIVYHKHGASTNK